MATVWKTKGLASRGFEKEGLGSFFFVSVGGELVFGRDKEEGFLVWMRKFFLFFLEKKISVPR